MRRSKHSLSHYRLLTASMGQLYPIACFEVLPGDTVQHATSLLLRVSPLLAPVMHPIQVRVHHWFVPNRLVMSNWEEFITGNNGGSAIPMPTLGPFTATKGELADYFGLPVGVAINPIALPFSAYSLIWNEYYRDQDLQAELDIGSNRFVRGIAWEKDYFTSSRPWPQKGPDVTLPLGVQAPVKGIGFEVSGGGAGNQAPANTNVFETGGARQYPNGVYINTTAGQRHLTEKDNASGLPKIFADLTNATAVNINDVRKAFALQRYQEARAQYGSRYTEYLAFLGVKSSDARLQRPEYLGGGKTTISFSEVLRTGNETAGVPPAVIGELKGHGISALRSRRYRRFFEEHGHVLSLMSVRPRTMYVDGADRMWFRRTKEDYWQRELELIGQQPVFNGEVFGSGVPATDTGVFGYIDRYAEYRHIQSRVCGDFRDTLNFWHLARDFAALPTLNESFIQCDPSKRINAEQTTDNLWVMASHSIQARRLVGKNTIGRVM